MRRNAIGAIILAVIALCVSLPAAAGVKPASSSNQRACPAAKSCAAYALKSHRWPTTRGIATLGFVINPVQPWVLMDDAESAILAAAKTWSAVHPAIKVAYKGRTTSSTALGDGINSIGWSTLGNNNLATANIYLRKGVVAEADITLNASYPWSWTPCAQRDGSCTPVAAELGALKRFDIQAVVTHEIGHWLGLDHRGDGNAAEQTMFTTIQPGERKQSTPALGDITAVRRAYACKKCPPVKVFTP